MGLWRIANLQKLIVKEYATDIAIFFSLPNLEAITLPICSHYNLCLKPLEIDPVRNRGGMQGKQTFRQQTFPFRKIKVLHFLSLLGPFNSLKP